MASAWRLDGKRALITGGTEGIGYAIAQEFLDLGCEVIIVARNAEDVRNTTLRWNEKNFRRPELLPI
jgi:Tropinone reductase 1